jgi:hypothetical protein
MSNMCPCPNPPGGQIVCSADQLAICGFRDGSIVSGCFDKPLQARHAESKGEADLIVANWSLSMITGVSRPFLQSLGDEDLQLLQSGEYRSGATLIKFSLPEDIELASAGRTVASM